jgi:hypothetical protein
MHQEAVLQQKYLNNHLIWKRMLKIEQNNKNHKKQTLRMSTLLNTHP